jgi:hypothetical protein
LAVREDINIRIADTAQTFFTLYDSLSPQKYVVVIFIPKFHELDHWQLTAEEIMEMPQP